MGPLPRHRPLGGRDAAAFRTIMGRGQRLLGVPDKGRIAVKRNVVLLLAGALAGAAAHTAASETALAANSEITILYDAFGSDAAMKKDWGFSALIEVGGKRILFDTGNDGDIFAANVKAKGID